MTDRLLGLLQGGVLQPLPFILTGTAARVMAIVDILLVAALLTALFRFLRRTRATNILGGFVLVGGGIVIARLLNLATLNVILTVFLALLVFSLPMLFQPELRRGLERLGRRGPFRSTTQAWTDASLRTLVESVERLRATRRGALIILERHTGLTEYIDTGVPLHADLRGPLLEALFAHGSPLHDGAVILRGDSVAAAACTLPLADGGTPGRYGTRHRAALGITEVTDAIAIIVSEERGTVSVAADGRLKPIARPHDLGPSLRTLLQKTR